MDYFQEFPKWKYHYSEKSVIVKNAEEEANLGGGWGDSPGAFAQFKGPRRAGPRQYDPVKWVDEWAVQDLSGVHRRKIKAHLLKAHAAFWRAPDESNAETEAMRLAFNGIAQTLFDAGLLTDRLLETDIPPLAWDSAIAGGWWRLASETRHSMFPEQLGHYWVWRDDSRDWNMLFRAEAAEWQARLLEGPAELAAESDQPASAAPSRTDRKSEVDRRPAERQAETETGRSGRLQSTIASATAARRLEEFLQHNNIGLTEFASRVGTTDRTLRAFRQTGRVRRSIFDAIAREMGTTRELLLKP